MSVHTDKESKVKEHREKNPEAVIVVDKDGKTKLVFRPGRDDKPVRLPKGFPPEPRVRRP